MPVFTHVISNLVFHFYISSRRCVKVLDDNVFDIINSRCIFYFYALWIIWSLLGVKKRLGLL